MKLKDWGHVLLGISMIAVGIAGVVIAVTDTRAICESYDDLHRDQATMLAEEAFLYHLSRVKSSRFLICTTKKQVSEALSCRPTSEDMRSTLRDALGSVYARLKKQPVSPLQEVLVIHAIQQLKSSNEP